jgi:hypothetical protein
MPSETEELIHLAEERLESARLHDREVALLQLAAQRQTDLRRILWAAIVAGLAAIGTAATFWDDIVRNEIRLENLEHRHEAPPAEPPGFWSRTFGGD